MNNEFAPLNEMYEIMQDFQNPWFICGGWAIDLELGRKTRDHKDVDIGTFREDQLELQTYLGDWSFFKVLPDSRDIVEWKEGEYLEKPIHETRARKDSKEVEFLLNDSDETSWIYRRNDRVHFPKEKLIRYRDNLPYWAPEISLLYKAKTVRPHDEEDFEAILGELSSDAKMWLKEAIQDTHPGHQWISKL
ncbi:MAG: hypothetical protein WEC84_00355 [Candidatus Andersenbacteria bacterium]